MFILLIYFFNTQDENELKCRTGFDETVLFQNGIKNENKKNYYSLNDDDDSIEALKSEFKVRYEFIFKI